MLKRYKIDSDLAWNFGRYLAYAIAGPILSFAVLRYLTPVVQGYYYTFASLLSLQVFFELGFAVCITQFISHEYAHVKFGRSGQIEGDSKSILRLGGIAKLALKWYSVLSVGIFVFLVVAGYMFFRSPSHSIDWFVPWALIVLGSSVGIFYDAFIAVFNGLNQVAWTAKLAILRNAIRLLCTLVLLVGGAQLYALGVATLIANLVLLVQILVQRKNELRSIYSLKGKLESWTLFREIWPMQWRIALSWICGYFIFSAFNPIIFKTEGPVAAGRFGITWTIVQAIATMAQVPVNTRMPQWGIFIAKGDVASVTKSWRKATYFAFGMVLFGGIVLWVLLLVLKYYTNYRERLLSDWEILPLIGGALANQFIFSVAALGRSNKQEPFLEFSLIEASLVLLGTLFFGKHFGVLGVTWNYFLTLMILLPYAEYLRKKIKSGTDALCCSQNMENA